MSDKQRVIKYCALGIALVIIVAIFSTIFNAINWVVDGIFSFTNGRSRESISNLTYDSSQLGNDITSVDIKHSVGELYVYSGSELKVEAQNVSSKFRCYVRNNTLYIDSKFEPTIIFGVNNPTPQIYVYLPAECTSERFRVEAGAGKTYIEGIYSDKLNVQNGAGQLVMRTVSCEKADISGGVGELRLSDVKLNNLRLECGIGKTTVEGDVYGRSELQSGIGELTMDLVGNRLDYELNISTGIGRTYIDGEDLSDGVYNRGAANSIRLESGIGAAKLNFGR